MKAYKQKVIPEILTNSAVFKNQIRAKLNVFAEAYYHKNIKGKSVLNVCSNHVIHFYAGGGKKIVYGSALYPYKAMVLVKLLEAMKYATLNNFGLRKEKDSPSVLGYLNYKVKVRIDGEIKNFRISCILNKDGKVFYNHEMNKPPRTKVLKP